jgi:non-specific serine/threonine protein kinase
MLETVRQYALDRLRESPEESQWRDSHLACFGALASTFNKEVFRLEQQSWLTRIASEHDNLRAALAWSTEASPSEGLRLATNLDAFWRIRGYLAEGREWLARLLAVVPIERSTRDRARGLYAAGMVASMQGDYAAARGLLQESRVLFREIDQPKNVATALDALAYLAIEQAEYPEAEALSRQVVDFARATNDRWLLYPSLSRLAAALHRQGNWAAARELYEELLVVARELGTPWQIGFALNGIGWAECDEGRCDLALKHLAEGMTILHGLGDRPGVIESLDGHAGVAAATAAPRRAVRLWGAADALRQETGRAMSVHESIAYERQVKPVRATLTTEAFDQAWGEGRAMSLDDAVRYALDQQAGRDT